MSTTIGSIAFENLSRRDTSSVEDAVRELDRIRDKFGGEPFASAHEAYGVLAEEVDEFWGEVKKKRSKRSRKAMRSELIQIAAVAIRAISDLTGE